MTGKTHLACGSAIAVTISLHLIGTNTVSGMEGLIICLGGMVGSLAPDIDEPNSNIGRLLPFISIPYKLIGVILRAIGYIMPGILGRKIMSIGRGFKHRHFTHHLSSFIIIMIISAFICALSLPVGLVCVVYCLGVLSHIILDRISNHLIYDGLAERLIRVSFELIVLLQTAAKLTPIF